MLEVSSQQYSRALSCLAYLLMLDQHYCAILGTRPMEWLVCMRRDSQKLKGISSPQQGACIWQSVIRTVMRGVTSLRDEGAAKLPSLISPGGIQHT